MTPKLAKIIIRVGLAALPVLLVLSALIYKVIKAETPRSGPCPDMPKGQRTSEPKTEPARLQLREQQPTTLGFGRSLSAKSLDIILDVNPAFPPGTKLKLSIDDFRREVDPTDARIDRSRIHAGAIVEERGRVRLAFCVDRRNPDTADPGTYVGTVTFVDPGASELSIPITVTLSYHRFAYPLIGAIVIILVGVPYVWALRGRADLNDRMLSRKTLRSVLDWSATLGGLASIAAGTAGAATVFTATYLASPSWGTGMPQILSLLGAMFTGFVTAATAINIGSQMRKRDNRTEQPPQETPPATK